MAGAATCPTRRLARKGVAVDPAHLAAYARVCGLPLNDVLPATYPHMLTFPLQMALMSDRSFPLALPGLVHVRNRIEVLRPIGSDAPLDLEVWAERFAPHRSGAAVDLCATVSAGGAGGLALAVDLPRARGDGARRARRRPTSRWPSATSSGSRPPGGSRTTPDGATPRCPAT